MGQFWTIVNRPRRERPRKTAPPGQPLYAPGSLRARRSSIAPLRFARPSALLPTPCPAGTRWGRSHHRVPQSERTAISDTSNIPKDSNFIVVSDAQLTAFARAVIVAYREEQSERPQSPALISTRQLVVDILIFEAQVNGVVVPMLLHLTCCWIAPRSSWTRLTKETKLAKKVISFGFTPVVPPKSNRLEPWEYDRLR